MLNLKFHFQNGEVLDVCYRYRLDVSKKWGAEISTRWPHVARLRSQLIVKVSHKNEESKLKVFLHLVN